VLGFVALVPWLRTLDAERRLAGALAGAWAMAIAFTAAVFAWFGSAIGAYTGVGAGVGLGLLLLGAPLFQPQFLAFALVRHVARRRLGAAAGALAAAAAWVATESLVPRLLGDTLGDGLQPAHLLCQAADIGGATGLTLLLLLANEAGAACLARRGRGLRAMALPAALGACVPLALAGYGLAALARHGADEAANAGPPLRIGLVQSAIVDYERLRRERGTGAVVGQVLDMHFAMSYDAVERQHADAVLWSETVYPTTFGHPKSAAGATFDREILDMVDAAGVPFVFGTYDRDAAGEYNAAAFVEPGAGLLAFYRKARPFPLTEHVPEWLDSPALRHLMPWAGSWQAGAGARVLPLRLADGREIPVLPLICLDDTDARLAIDGARLGARAILTMSNDSWFPLGSPGAALHQAAAALRSIETRLPQFRATTNGDSAVIDATGRVIASARPGERTLVIGAVPVPVPPRTLMVAWGDWVGRTAAAGLALLALATAWRAWGGARKDEAPADAPPPLPADVALLPPAARVAAGALRAFARASLLALGLALLLGDGALQSDVLARIRAFTVLFLVPEAAAWCVLRAFAARASLEDGALVFTRGPRRLALPLAQLAAVEPWRVPIPGPGGAVRLASGARWRHGIAHPDPAALARALAAAAGRRPAPQARRARPATSSPAALYASARAAMRHGRLDHPLAKFVLFPLALALPAFRLHEHIAYGSALGEVYAFGLGAWLAGFALWWAAWAMGLVLCAAALRATIEGATLAAVLLRPEQAVGARRALERLGRLAFYVGLPAWLAVRLLSA
jgi:apolipoprotein N-acyltransferase